MTQWGKKIIEGIQKQQKQITTINELNNFFFSSSSFFPDGFEQVKKLNISFVTSGSVLRWWGAIIHVLWLWLTADVVNILLILLIFGMGGIGVLLYRQVNVILLIAFVATRTNLTPSDSILTLAGAKVNRPSEGIQVCCCIAKWMCWWHDFFPLHIYYITVSFYSYFILSSVVLPHPFMLQPYGTCVENRRSRRWIISPTSARFPIIGVGEISCSHPRDSPVAIFGNVQGRHPSKITVRLG